MKSIILNYKNLILPLTLLLFAISILVFLSWNISGKKSDYEQLSVQNKQLRKENSELEESIASLETEMLNLQATYEQSLLQYEAIQQQVQVTTALLNSAVASESMVKDFTAEKAKIRAESETIIFELMSNYCALKTNYGYEITDWNETLTNDIISEIVPGGTMASDAVVAVKDAIVAGKDFNGILAEAASAAGAAVDDTVKEKIINELFGDTVGGIFSTALESGNEGEHIKILLNKLVTVQKEYVTWFTDILGNEELDMENVAVSARKAENLSELLEEIEMQTGNDMGSALWREYAEKAQELYIRYQIAEFAGKY